MEIRLAENIRNFRKERALTQEQLSEVLGVTAGAVYKWEAKLSVPELDLIIQMADFFDTSVDVLLGYEIKDNRLEATVNYPCLKARVIHSMIQAAPRASVAERLFSWSRRACPSVM